MISIYFISGKAKPYVILFGLLIQKLIILYFNKNDYHVMNKVHTKYKHKY